MDKEKDLTNSPCDCEPNCDCGPDCDCDSDENCDPNCCC